MEESHEVERERRALDQMKGPYRWAMYEDWERLRRYYKDNPTKVLDPLTTYNDNALHLVAFAGRMDVLQFLIALIREPQMLRRALTMKNSHGNTTLHEVAPSGNLEAAVLLVDLDNNVRDELADVMKDDVSNEETALWLLKEYPDLADKKESNGLTSLQLLAQMPSVFQAKFRKSIWKMLIYKCLLMMIILIGSHQMTWRAGSITLANLVVQRRLRDSKA
ncbi:uncharacterized protein LOC110772859 isoform X2 [Prunus avium]|uniref:Uncharacterized protein LOC110772859 isoform X2 n=1 Tax=Prunus avium TaxID=42229 RepID=A0A6P5U1M4_PRUAV|nr:uncharacterized protein LOC110772859 isoform X2 [Prunus avium]